MNLFRNNINLNSSLPSPMKMKKSSGVVTLAVKPLALSSPRVTLIDLFQTKSLSKDCHSNLQNGEKSDSENSSPRSSECRPDPKSVIIPESDSDSEGKVPNNLACARDCCIEPKKDSKKSGKAKSLTSYYNSISGKKKKPNLFRSLSQDNRPRSIRSFKLLKSPRKTPQQFTMSQEINNTSSDSRGFDISRSAERYRRIRARKTNENCNEGNDKKTKLFSSSKNLKIDHQNPIARDSLLGIETPEKTVSDEEIIIDEKEPEAVTTDGGPLNVLENEGSLTCSFNKNLNLFGANPRDEKNVELIGTESDEEKILSHVAAMNRLQEIVRERSGSMETIVIASSSSENSENPLSWKSTVLLNQSIKDDKELRGFGAFSRGSSINSIKSPQSRKDEEEGSEIVEVVDLDENKPAETNLTKVSLSNCNISKIHSFELKNLSVNLSKAKKICDAHISKGKFTRDDSNGDTEELKVEETLIPGEEIIGKIEGKLHKVEKISEEKTREHEGKSEKSCEYSSIMNGITFKVLTTNQAEKQGHIIRPETKARLKAQQAQNKLVERRIGKKRGRKAGSKNKPRSENSSDVPLKKKRGRKKKSTIDAQKNHNNNNEATVALTCCIERGCCCTSGCLHGNNHKRPGRLPSLPEKPEYIFAEQQYENAIKEKNAQLHAQQELEAVSVTSNSSSHLLGMSFHDDITTYHTASKPTSRPAAIIEFPPTVISGDSDLEGKTVRGFTVPLVSEVTTKQRTLNGRIVPDNESLAHHIEKSDSSPENRENSSDDNKNNRKPKIIREKILPKGTIDHLFISSPDSQECANRKRTYDTISTGGTSSFGIKSTVPCKKSLNPPKSSALDAESVASKVLSSFYTTWSTIPEIAVLLEPPIKKIRIEESPDEETMDIPEIKSIEKRKSLLSQSVNNTDLNSGRISNSSIVLKGLFSNPHILSSASAKDSHRSEKISNTCSKKKDKLNFDSNTEKLKKELREENSRVKRGRILTLTKENLEALDKSTGSSKGSLDIITDIINQMQPPGKSVLANNTLDSSRHPKESTGNMKIESKKIVKNEEKIIIMPNECSKITETKRKSLEEKKRVKKKERKGRWSLHDDEHSSGTSTETHPSVLLSYKSSRCSLFKFGDNNTSRKDELIDSWLSKDITSNNEHKDDNFHSPHSAKTYIKTPPSINEGTTSGVSKKAFHLSRDTDKQIEEIQPDFVKQANCSEVVGKIFEQREPDNTSSISSSPTTATKSLSDTIPPSQERNLEEKQNSLEFYGDESTRDALEQVSKSHEKTSEKNNPDKDDQREEEGEDDALFLDCEEDDYFFDEPSEPNENQKDKEKVATIKSTIGNEDTSFKEKKMKMKKIVMAITDEETVNNERKLVMKESARRIHSSMNPENFPSQVKTKNLIDDKNGEILERESTTSDLYQMSNIDRYASQTRREFNDAFYGYSKCNEADIHESDDHYDPYAPVQQEARSMYFPKDPQQYFRGLCYANLKSGICNRLDCTFHNNKYTIHLQNLSKAPFPLIELVLNYALEKNYFHLLSEIYPETIKNLELRPIERICKKIRDEVLKTKNGSRILNMSAYKFYQNSMKPTVEALTSKGYTLKTIINILTGSFLLSEDDDRKKLMRALLDSKQVPPGEHWNTFETLIKQLEGSPPAFMIRPILEDCLKYDKSREYLEAVYDNVIRRIPKPLLAGFDQGLVRPFRQFFQSSQTLQLPQRSTTPMPDELQEFNQDNHHPDSPEQDSRETEEIPPIASPDSFKHSEDNEKEKQEDIIQVVKKKHVKERLGPRVVVKNSRKVEKAEPLELIPIDRVRKPTSVYGKYLWKLHIDLKSIQANLKHREYERVIEILARVKKEQTQPFAKGFYLILCEEIMTSVDHLEAIIKRSVGGRKFRALPLLSEIGALLLIKLADRGTWILAYRLLNTLQRMFQMKKSSKHFLLTSEIFIANHRPLKALSLLKQYKLISMHRDRWSLKGNLQDELLRISVLKSLFKSLSQNSPDQAFNIFKVILEEQAYYYAPFDLSKYIDDICISLLKSNKTDELIDLAQLVIRRHLTIQQLTLRSLIIRVFHQDVALSRQLYEYGIWIGIYPIINVEPPAYLRVNTDWVEEEMFLQISDVLSKMQKLFDPSIRKEPPKNVSIYVNFEIVNSRGEFSLGYDTISGEYNDVLLTNAKTLMRQVLKRFDPEIRIACDTGRIFKLMNEDVIEFLTSDHIF